MLVKSQQQAASRYTVSPLADACVMIAIIWLTAISPSAVFPVIKCSCPRSTVNEQINRSFISCYNMPDVRCIEKKFTVEKKCQI